MSKKGENIYKRKDGRWEARYIKSRTAGGVAKYGYCYAKTYREAKQKANKAATEVAFCKNLPEIGNAASVDRYCEEWLKLKRGAVKPSTYVKYFTVTEKHIKPHLGNCPISALNSLTAEQFGYDLIHKNGLSAKTVRDILTVLRSVLRYAEKRIPQLGKIDIVYPKSEKSEPRVLTRAEQERLMLYLGSDTDLCKFGALLALLTGLRIGELCALRWKDISVTDATLSVKASMQRIKRSDGSNLKDKTEIVISNPKSFSSARIIPLSPLALELCIKFYATPNAFVLTGSESRYIEPRTMQYRMSRYASDCGLDGVHFHTLRHSFATRCVEVGFEIKSLSEILGHACPQITLERYVHSSIELKKENILKLTAVGY